jgi:hypothetical protein
MRDEANHNADFLTSPRPGWTSIPGVAAHKPVFIQAFMPESSVKGFDMGVLVGLARLDSEQLHTARTTPELFDPLEAPLLSKVTDSNGLKVEKAVD